MSDEAVHKVWEQSPYTGDMLEFHLAMVRWAVLSEPGEWEVPAQNLDHVAQQLDLSRQDVLSKITRMVNDRLLAPTEVDTIEFRNWEQNRPSTNYALNLRD